MGIIGRIILSTVGVFLFIIVLPYVWMFSLLPDLIPVAAGVFLFWLVMKIASFGRFKHSFLTTFKYPLLISLIYFTPMTKGLFLDLMGGLSLYHVFSILSIDGWNPGVILLTLFKDLVVLAFWLMTFFAWGVVFSYVHRGIVGGLLMIWWGLTGRADTHALDEILFGAEMQFYESLLNSSTMPDELHDRLRKIPEINNLLMMKSDSGDSNSVSKFDELDWMTRLTIVKSLGYDVRPLDDFRTWLVKSAHPIYKYFASPNPFAINHPHSKMPYHQKMPTTELPVKVKAPPPIYSFPEFLRIVV